MENNITSREIALHLDQLRRLRNISQETFLNDIVSIRQFKRYLAGESELSFNIFNSLSLVLNLTPDMIIAELKLTKERFQTEIYHAFNAISENDFELAGKLIESIENKYQDKSNENNFLALKITYDFNLKKISSKVYILELKKIISYDTLIKKKIFTMDEIMFLSNVIVYDEPVFAKEVADKLSTFISSNIHILDISFQNTILVVFEQLSKYYGLNKDYEQSLIFAQHGINYALKVKTFYLLEHLYYYESLNYHFLENYIERNKSVLYCCHVLILRNSQVKLDYFIKLFKKDFNMDITNYINFKFD